MIETLLSFALDDVNVVFLRGNCEKIVHGHTPEIQPVWDGRRIGVDTGAYMTGKLSTVRIFNDEIQLLST